MPTHSSALYLDLVHPQTLAKNHIGASGTHLDLSPRIASQNKTLSFTNELILGIMLQQQKKG